MENQHWSDEDFVAHIYGVGPENKHLGSCEVCRRRAERYARCKESLRIEAPDLTEAAFAAQRRAILSRLDAKPFLFRPRLLPSFAAILLALVILTMFRPAPKPQSSEIGPDMEFYQDVFSIAASASPSAVEPLQSLFEVQQ